MLESLRELTKLNSSSI